MSIEGAWKLWTDGIAERVPQTAVDPPCLTVTSGMQELTEMERIDLMMRLRGPLGDGDFAPPDGGWPAGPVWNFRHWLRFTLFRCGCRLVWASGGRIAQARLPRILGERPSILVTWVRGKHVLSHLSKTTLLPPEAAQ